VFGMEKMPKGIIRSSFFEPWREQGGLAVTPAYFALRAQRVMRESGVTKEHLARVVVKNRANGANNPNAMYQSTTTAEDVLASRVVCEPLHLHMLCSPNEGAAARAPRLDVDDRHTGEPERAEHLVAGGDARVHGRAEGGLEPRVAGIGERTAHGGDGHVGDRDAVEAPERMDPDARDLDAGHHAPPSPRPSPGANAYVITAVPSSSVCSVSATNRIAWPNASALGSGSVSRVITRRPSVSSTMPNPNGISPS